MATKMKLADFYQYVRQSHKRIGDIYREIEEVQFQFNDLYSQQQAERSKLIANLVPHFSPDARQSLPGPLKTMLAERILIERRAIREEIAALSTRVDEQRTKSDGVLKEAQRQAAHLREQNPILDQQEEQLKARLASMEADVEQLDADRRRLRWFPIGWLTNMRKRRQLQKEREGLESNISAVQDGIRKVREKWQQEKGRLQETQAELQGQWQSHSVEASQTQARLDFLAANIEDESLRNAAWNLIGSLTAVPVTEGAWVERLQPVVELTKSKVQYEAGLRSVAEILGLLKGLGEGMDRFIRSVATVYEEQRRYKLQPLTVTLTKAVADFHAIWPDLQSKVKDEKYLGTHPVEFEQRISAVAPERLGEAAIQTMFKDMGDALSKATKAWH
jgi:myosin heavy subunit